MTATLTPSRMLSRREAARLLGVSPRTLDRWRRRGLVPAPVQLGARFRYPVEDLAPLAPPEGRITRKRAARLLDCSVRTLVRLSAAGVLVPVRQGAKNVFYHADDLERLRQNRGK